MLTAASTSEKRAFFQNELLLQSCTNAQPEQAGDAARHCLPGVLLGMAPPNTKTICGQAAHSANASRKRHHGHQQAMYTGQK